MAFPRSTERGPIEALRGRSSNAPTRRFRARQSAAPLKPEGVEVLRLEQDVFPRSTERGPIEAP